MLRPSHILQLSVVALLGVAVVMVHSAGMTIASGHGGRIDPTAMLYSRTTIYAALAVAAMLLASRINVRELFRVHGLANPLMWVLGATMLFMVLTLVPGIGKQVKGASRWLYLGPSSWGLSFQPSEMAKWVMVIVVAWWCARRRGVMHTFKHGLLPPMILIGMVCALVVIEDLGTAALVGMVAMCMLMAGGAKWWHLGMTVPPAAGAVVLAIAHSPYRLARLTAFMNPWADPQGIGYHPIQSMLAIAQGGLTGRGLGNGIQKFGYLPEDTTDFIFAIICEEMGVSGAVLIIGLYLVLLWVGLSIVRDCKDTFGRLVGLGILVTLGLQAMINIAVVTVVVPTKGIALPLVSSGGTGWIMTAFAIGLVASLDEANRLESIRQLPEVEPLEVAPARQAA
ncbi:MAG: putative lipid II flippase FtsW [Planctomycetes bacterium]|nr:putative lipid II flippase FtsW [Planctomycetota bacterium]